jgi:hypothetical protein
LCPLETFALELQNKMARDRRQAKKTSVRNGVKKDKQSKSPNPILPSDDEQAPNQPAH